MCDNVPFNVRKGRHIKSFHSIHVFQSYIETDENSKTALDILGLYWYDWKDITVNLWM